MLFLDEPTAALDRDATESVERLVTRWHRDSSDRAYLWVSHDDAQAERVGTKSWRMEEGALSRGKVS